MHRISPRSNDNYTMPRPDVSIRACHRKAAHIMRIEHFTQRNTERSGHGHALHCTHHPRAVRRGAAHISRTLTRAWISHLCASLRRPFLRRLSRTLRPAFVLIRWRKPCVRARLRRFGCHVRFGIAWTFSGVGASGWSGICASGARTSSCLPKSLGSSNSRPRPAQWIDGGRRAMSRAGCGM